MDEKQEKTLLHALQDLRTDLSIAKSELVALRKHQSGVARIALGVLFGLVLYSLVGVVASLLMWGSIINWAADARSAERQDTPAFTVSSKAKTLSNRKPETQ